MRRTAWAALALSVLTLSGWAVTMPDAAWAQAQPAPITATPLLPPSRQYAPQGLPPAPAPGQPGVTQSQPGATPAPTATPLLPPAANLPNAQQNAPDQAAPGQAPSGQAPQEPAPPAPNPWLPQGQAMLQVLDKPNAQSKTLTVKVGQSASYGSLTIAVQACVIRPPDMPQDAAAFLVVADQHADQPGFRGWMVKSDPSLTMLQNPIYDVRVLGCGP